MLDAAAAHLSRLAAQARANSDARRECP